MSNHKLIIPEDRKKQMIRNTRLTDEISLSRLLNRTVIGQFSSDQYMCSNPSHQPIFYPYIVNKIMDE